MRTLLLLPLILLGCTNNTETNKKEAGDRDSSTLAPRVWKQPDITEKPSPPAPGTCYWQIMQRDTFVAVFSKTGARVSGKLSFDNYEKDGSTGNINGTTKDNIMKLWYSFESEGMRSIMEVWFKIEGDKILRGTGDMSVRSDTSYFNNPRTVSFESGQELNKVDCSEIPSKYK